MLEKLHGQLADAKEETVKTKEYNVMLKDELSQSKEEALKTRGFNAMLTESRDATSKLLDEERHAHASAITQYESERARFEELNTQIQVERESGRRQLERVESELAHSLSRFQQLESQHTDLVSQLSQSFSKRARMSMGWILSGKWPVDLQSASLPGPADGGHIDSVEKNNSLDVQDG